MLGIVVRKNPYFRTGTWVSCDDDGCIKVDVETVEQRLRIVREVGFYMPRREVVPCLMRPKKTGLDR